MFRCYITQIPDHSPRRSYGLARESGMTNRGNMLREYTDKDLQAKHIRDSETIPDRSSV